MVLVPTTPGAAPQPWLSWAGGGTARCTARGLGRGLRGGPGAARRGAGPAVDPVRGGRGRRRHGVAAAVAAARRARRLRGGPLCPGGAPLPPDRGARIH